MTINTKDETFYEVYRKLKVNYRVSDKIFHLQDYFLSSKKSVDINPTILNISELSQLISFHVKRSKEKANYEEYMDSILDTSTGGIIIYPGSKVLPRPDNLDGFLRYILHLRGGEKSDSQICVMKSTIFDKFVKNERDTDRKVKNSLMIFSENTVSRFFNDGINIREGLNKKRAEDIENLKFFVC
jgi:hypothetical protein